jgi:hypothetical protein
MGIAEIQAAFAASAAQPPASNPFSQTPALTPFAQGVQAATAPAPFAVQLTPAAPSPAFPAVAANPFAAHAAPAVAAALNAPAPAPFAFTPPAGFAPASAPPINPPGERQSLNTAPALVEAPPASAVVEPVVAPEPATTTRKRKPRAGATNAGGMPGLVAPAPEDVSALVDAAVRTATEQVSQGYPPGTSPKRPALVISLDDALVDFLVDRGYAVRLERA